MFVNILDSSERRNGSRETEEENLINYKHNREWVSERQRQQKVDAIAGKSGFYIEREREGLALERGSRV